MKRVLFLDRDGVINVDTGYLHKQEDLIWVDGVKDGLAAAVQAGYELIVVTNQSGIARGYYGEEDVKALHSYMGQVLKDAGAPILHFYYCPHYAQGSVKAYAIDCNCRKPKPGMLLQAMADYDIDVNHSFLIGDSVRDVEAAEAAGLRGYLFTGGSMAEFVKSCLHREAVEGV